MAPGFRGERQGGGGRLGADHDDFGLALPRGCLVAVDHVAEAREIFRAEGFGQHDAVRAGRDHRLNVFLAPGGIERVDADIAAGTRARLGERLHDDLARLRLGVGTDGVFEIEDDHVGGAGRRFGDHLLGVAGDEQQRAHHAAFGFLRISAARSQVATTSPFWLVIS